MISAVTLGYQLPGEEPTKVTISVTQTNEASAFDEAVDRLKVDLLQATADFPIGRRDAFRTILRLRPWAHDYTYVKRPESRSTWDWSDPEHADRIA